MSDEASRPIGRVDSAVFVADEQLDVPIDVARWQRLARLVLRSENVDPDVQVALVFVDEPAIAALNEQFLGHEGPTDVLAFPIDEDVVSGRRPDQGGRGPGAGHDDSEIPALLGDVYVCPAVAQRQAREVGKALDDEVALLVAHGVLHLLEYDHMEPEDAAAMQQRERELLAAFAAEEARR
jgi:probable rRNA maturation factor